MEVALNLYHNANNFSEPEVESENEDSVEAHLDFIRPGFPAEDIELEPDGDGNDDMANIIPVEVPFRDIDPDYGLYEDAVLSVIKKWNEEGVNPNESDAESVGGFYSDDDSALQRMINFELKKGRERQQVVRKNTQTNDAEVT